jgi:hypothetical protein
MLKRMGFQSDATADYSAALQSAKLPSFPMQHGSIFKPQLPFVVSRKNGNIVVFI